MKTLTIHFCIGVLLMGAGAAHADGLLKVDQTIFGMDCAPCAYGVQKRILALPGVTKVEVSLNDGIAHIELGTDSPATLLKIHDTLIDGGFTPKQAVVTVEGRIVSAGGGLQLLAAGGKYALVFASGQALPQADAHVVVVGQVADTGAEPQLTVQSVAPAPAG